MIILVGGEKGGTGKTTLITNLAAMRAKTNDVLLVDTDKQTTSNFWVETRDENKEVNRVACVQKYGKGLRTEILDLKKRYEDIFIDAGGQDSIELRTALTVADVFYTPVQPSQFDVWTFTHIDNLVEAACSFNRKLKSYVIINRASPNPSVKEAKEAEELLADFENLEFSGITVCDRIAYRKAASQGLSVSELKPLDPKAVDEMNSFYKKVYNES